MAEVTATPSETHEAALSDERDETDFFETVDGWGADQWFDRLAKAIRKHDEARRAGNDLVADTMHNIASSSAFRLVRDYEPEVRAALARRTQPSAGEVGAVTRDQIYAAAQAANKKMQRWMPEPWVNAMADALLASIVATPPDQSRVERLEATEAALIWAMDEIDILSNKLCQFGYPQGMSILDRRNQIDNYRKAVDARRQALHGDRP